jgi:hypothetical protein
MGAPCEATERHALTIAGSGNDCRRALELARANVANRPTCRAVKQAHATSVNADAVAAASHLHEACNAGCGDNR